MFDIVTTVGLVLAGLIALRAVRRIEPHWASRDGRQFTARVQPLQAGNRASDVWREMRAGVTAEGIVVLRPRGLVGSSLAGDWRVARAEVDERHRKAMYVAHRPEGHHSGASGAREDHTILIRIPLSSRSRGVLDALAASGHGSAG